ncbi:MAG: trypsin-like peptidase domain-containing protein, partial [Mycolicibacterium sp.]|nr:trypsin-like peptidase domain-containing protein [Mycolicibacterium sp.]
LRDDPANADDQTRVVVADGRTAPFSVVGADPVTNIAVVRAASLSGLTPITVGSSADLHVGQQVVAVGSPLGLNGTVTSGIISALNRPLDAAPDWPATSSGAIQTDAALNPGNFGGALVDMTGRLIGMTVAVAGPDNASGETGSTGLGFAIPVDLAKPISDRLIAAGSSPPISGRPVGTNTG